MIKTVLFARETPISLKDFRAHLLSAERTIETRLQAMSHNMTGFVGSTSYEYGSSSHTVPNSSVAPVVHLAAQPQSSPMHDFSGFKPQSHGSAQSHSSSHTLQHSSSYPYRGRGSNGRFSSNQHGGYNPRFSSGSKVQAIQECQICNKRGHTAPNCYYRIRDSSNSSPVVEC